MAYYLIDFENVKSRGMEGVELLTEEDTVCIFYSDNADSMTFDLHRKLNETKANIIYHKVAVGTKNALDFQLATYLGYLVCEQQREGIHPNYFIVTKDNGFTSLMVYWKAQGVPVRIIRNLLWGKNPVAEQNLLTEEENEELVKNFEIIYNSYPKKVGKASGFKVYKQWLNGRNIDGTKVKLTNRQMWYAIAKYKQYIEKEEMEPQYIKQFDTFMRNILDYVEDEQQ